MTCFKITPRKIACEPNTRGRLPKRYKSSPAFAAFRNRILQKTKRKCLPNRGTGGKKPWKNVRFSMMCLEPKDMRQNDPKEKRTSEESCHEGFGGLEPKSVAPPMPWIFQLQTINMRAKPMPPVPFRFLAHVHDSPSAVHRLRMGSSNLPRNCKKHLDRIPSTHQPHRRKENPAVREIFAAPLERFPRAI